MGNPNLNSELASVVVLNGWIEDGCEPSLWRPYRWGDCWRIGRATGAGIQWCPVSGPSADSLTVICTRMNELNEGIIQ